MDLRPLGAIPNAAGRDLGFLSKGSGIKRTPIARD